MQRPLVVRKIQTSLVQSVLCLQCTTMVWFSLLPAVFASIDKRLQTTAYIKSVKKRTKDITKLAILNHQKLEGAHTVKRWEQNRLVFKIGATRFLKLLTKEGCTSSSNSNFSHSSRKPYISWIALLLLWLKSNNTTTSVVKSQDCDI